ncbi:MAG: Gfo/Idh/MocA family oxidoreductase [Planctomycetota bacterium]
MNPVKIIIAGAGDRGSTYAGYAAKFPAEARIVGVADPRDHFRERMAMRHGIPPGNIFRAWEEMAERPKFADAAIVATHDSLHAGPAVAFAGKGYHILLEKPMAPNVADCRRIVAAAKAAGVILAVCHVMRYTAYTRKVKELVDAGRIGDVVSLQHLEPVGYWHQAHSYVRGNWRREDRSSPMLLAKSCHDLDWIHYIMGGRRCRRISSFGNLAHFRKDHKPAGAGAAMRCLDCAHEPQCPYSARKIYLGPVGAGRTGWPVSAITTDLTPSGVEKALREGPYGRCVYECDNDVVDHQVVAMDFEGGRSAVFTMTAFTEAGGRRTWIFGTKGSLFGDGSKIEVFDFLTDRKEVIDTAAGDAGISGGHGGGDFGLMQSFVSAVAAGNPKLVLSGADVSLETHQMVFAAERARHESRVVEMGE